MLINQKAQEQLFHKFNASIQADDYKKKLLDHQETLFLLNDPFGHMMNVFHNVTKLGSTVYDTSVKIIFIQGVGKDAATVMTPYTVILFKPK